MTSKSEAIKKTAKKMFGKGLKGRIGKAKAKALCALFINSAGSKGITLSKDSVMAFITGKASLLTEKEALDIGLAIKLVEEYNWLDLKLFVEECKTGVYDKEEK